MPAASDKPVSPRGGPVTVYAKIHDGLDHVLSLLLKGDDSVPPTLRLDGREAATPFVAWREIRQVAAERRSVLQAKEAKRIAKRKMKKRQLVVEDQEEEEEEADREGAEEEDEVQQPLLVVKQERVNPKKLVTTQGTVEVKAEKSKPKTVLPTLVVKTLDLSGTNLSPVVTHKKPPVKAVGRGTNSNGLHRQSSADYIKPLVLDSTAVAPDLLTRLRQVPLLENLDPTSNKYKAIVKWLELDDGKNKDLTRDLSTMILKLQKRGVPTVGNGKSSPGKVLSLGLETLDDRLKKDRQLEKERKKAARKAEKKEQAANGGKRGRRKTDEKPTAARETTRKRKLGGFVVGSDEEEFDEGEWVEESEEEYESGEDESSSAEDEEADSVEEETEQGHRDTRVSPRVSSREPTPPASAKASPRAASAVSQLPVAATQAPTISATDQLALVTTRIRESEKNESSATAAPTYLSYNKPPQSAMTGPSVTVKNEQNVSTQEGSPSSKLVLAAGSSVMNAIELSDSDEEESDTEAKNPSPPPPPYQAPPPSPKQPAKPRTKQQLKKQSAPPPPPKKSAAKALVKGKAAAGSTKKARKNKGSDDSDEAEFQAPGEEGSSTDADQDMFDLNEEDVYVVESILEVKPGRTLVTDFGRATKEADLYLVKWDGYDELTWEPDANIPKRLIDFFNDREAHKRKCDYAIDKFFERRVAKNSTTGKEEVLYLIQWKGYPLPYWEVKATIPQAKVTWLDKVSRASGGKAVISGPSPRKKAKT